MKNENVKGLPLLTQWLKAENLTQYEFGQMFRPRIGQSSVSKWFTRGRVSRGCLAEAQLITGLPLYALDPVHFQKPKRVA